MDRHPAATLTESQANAFARTRDVLSRRVIGQEHAIATVATRYGARAPDCKIPKPLGSFLFRARAASAKPNLRKRSARALFGTEDALVRIDLSEFTEAHTVSRLLGAPPGYAGHENPAN